MGPSEHRPSRDPARAVLDALTDPDKSTIFVTGPPGSGKSFVFNRLESALGDRHPEGSAPVFLRPTNGTRDVLLGDLLAPVPTIEDAGVAAAGAPTEPRVLAIDDIDLLDRSSMSLLTDSLNRKRFRLAATVRSSQAQDVFRTLRAVGGRAIVQMEPWDQDDLTTFAAELLGAHIHPLTSRRLLQFTGGNALCLTELIDLGARDGQLRRELDVWSWRGDLFIPPVTEARVSGELEWIDSECRSVLTTVALLEAVPVELLEKLHGTAVVEAADNTGLMLVKASAGKLVAQPTSVLQGRVLAQHCSTLRRRRLAAALVETLTGSAVPAQPVGLSAVRLAAACSLPVPPGLAVDAAREALRQHDPALAEDLLLQLTSASGDYERAEVLAAALLAQGRLDAASHALGEGTPVTPDPRTADQMRARRVALRLMAAPSASESPKIDDAGWCAAVRAWTGTGLADMSNAPLAAPTAGVVASDVQRSLLAGVASLVQVGQVTSALEAAGSLDVTRFDPKQRVTLLALVGSCRLFRGDLGEASTVAHELQELGLSEGWSYAYRLGALVAGRRALLSAESRSAERFLTESATCGVDTGSQALLPLTLAQLDLARTMSGRPSEPDPASDPTLVRATSSGGRSTPQAVQDLATLARAEVEFLVGVRHGAFEAALMVSDRSEEHGQILIALQALHLCSRIRPSAGIARRLVAAVGQADFDLARTYAVHAEAAVAGDGERLTRVAEEYDARGLRWLAAETGGTALAVALAHPTRRYPWAVDSRRLLDRLHAGGQVTVPAWWRHGSQPFDVLTDREREIVELVAVGWPSRRVAEHLQLSLRTVENHLQHSFRKLGITRRQQLSAVLGDTGRATVPTQYGALGHETRRR